VYFVALFESLNDDGLLSCESALREDDDSAGFKAA
jgi:hypothetical protein